MKGTKLSGTKINHKTASTKRAARSYLCLICFAKTVDCMFVNVCETVNQFLIKFQMGLAIINMWQLAHLQNMEDK